MHSSCVCGAVSVTRPMLRDYILVRPISYGTVDTFCPALGDSREGILEFMPRRHTESIHWQDRRQDTAGACLATSLNKGQTIEIRSFWGLRRVRESDTPPEDRAKGRTKEPMCEFGPQDHRSPQLAYNDSASSDARCHCLASNHVTTNAVCAVAGLGMLLRHDVHVPLRKPVEIRACS